MRLSSGRFALIGALVACVAVFAALPALAGAATKATTVTVTVNQTSEFAFKLSTKSVKTGAVTFKFSNGGMLPHDFELCSSNKGSSSANACSGKVTPMVTPGGTATLKVTLTKAGTYEYLCTVPGHAAAGMKGLLKVS